MPSTVILEKKQAQVAALAERIKGSIAGVIVDYKGINVEDDTKLRRELREAGIEYTVVKNTLLKRAAESAGLDGLDPVLEGTTAIATSVDDYVASARILQKYADGHDNFSLKSGYGKASGTCQASVKRSSSCNSLQRIQCTDCSICKRCSGHC